jgi:hypothetical protein
VLLFLRFHDAKSMLDEPTVASIKVKPEGIDEAPEIPRSALKTAPVDESMLPRDSAPNSYVAALRQQNLGVPISAIPRLVAPLESSQLEAKGASQPMAPVQEALDDMGVFEASLGLQQPYSWLPSTHSHHVRRRPSIEAMRLSSSAMPFPVKGRLPPISRKAEPPLSSNVKPCLPSIRQSGDSHQNLPARATGGSQDAKGAGKAPPLTLRPTRRLGRFSSSTVAASQRKCLKKGAAEAAERLNILDADCAYSSSEDSAADAYIAGCSESTSFSTHSGPGRLVEVGLGSTRAIAMLPPDVHVSLRYQQRKQQQAALQHARGGSLVGSADTMSSSGRSSEAWNVSQSSGLFASQNFSGGSAGLLPSPASFSLINHGGLVASRRLTPTMSSNGSVTTEGPSAAPQEGTAHQLKSHFKGAQPSAPF